ncbi:MAG: pectin esterase [Chitinophagaceae bacterium]|jgi:pectinesterase|nr:pectin esterase [Chitinophagaceae bacterium]
MKKINCIQLLIGLLFFQQANAQKIVTVSKLKPANFTTIQAAFDAVSANNTQPITIKVGNGIYYEKLVLDTRKNFVTLIGENKDSTIITYNNHARQVLANGDTINTWNSASFFIYADDFTAKNITIENNAGFNAGQAVAVFAYGNRIAFKNCNIKGFQDILFCSGSGSKQYYENCYLEGTTDFIFGPSTAVFSKCIIHSKKNSHVTAASTPREIPFGFVFFNCTLTADSNINKVSLGRPWQPNAAVAYINCNLGSHIIKEGWSNWKNSANEATARYSEYESTGLGANATERVKWSKQLTTVEVKQYTLENILGTWKPYVH